VSFLGPSPSRFTAVTSPEKATSVGVVVCSPLWAEQMKNYRREVLLGRALAVQGFVCARFHYRGVGNSGGNPSALDVPSMTDDALIVAEHIRSEFGVTNLVFVGTRL